MGGKELKRDRNLSICGLQMELNVLHPLAVFKDQIEENSEAFSQLRDEERVRGLVLSVLRLARRGLSHILP
jgi:hypothetical protein